MIKVKNPWILIKNCSDGHKFLWKGHIIVTRIAFLKKKCTPFI
jgi:hypothetical protein